MVEKKAIIVCIEDDVEMIDLFKLVLGRQGYIVLGADGGREGLEMIQREQPNLVLLDLMMPEMDGWEVFQKLKAKDETKNIPVIIVTAKAQNIDRVLGLHIARVDDYITKPFSPNDLVERIDNVLKNRTHA